MIPMTDTTAAPNNEDKSQEFRRADASPRFEIPWKALLAIGSLASLVIGPMTWVLGTVKDGNAEVRVEISKSHDSMKSALGTHAEHPHSKAVPREVYEAHVAKANERHEESKAERATILDKLDHIGRRTHGEKRWVRVQEKE